MIFRAWSSDTYTLLIYSHILEPIKTNKKLPDAASHGSDGYVMHITWYTQASLCLLAASLTGCILIIPRSIVILLALWLVFPQIPFISKNGLFPGACPALHFSAWQGGTFPAIVVCFAGASGLALALCLQCSSVPATTAGATTIPLSDSYFTVLSIAMISSWHPSFL